MSGRLSVNDSESVSLVASFESEEPTSLDDALLAEEIVRQCIRPQDMSDEQLKGYPYDRMSLRSERINIALFFVVHLLMLAGVLVCTFLVLQEFLWQLSQAFVIGLGSAYWLLHLVVWLVEAKPLGRAVRALAGLCGVAHVFALLPYCIAHRKETALIFGETADQYRATIALFVINGCLLPVAVLAGRELIGHEFGEVGCLRTKAADWDTMTSRGKGRKAYRVSYKDRVIFSGFIEEFKALQAREEPSPGDSDSPLLRRVSVGGVTQFDEL